METARGLAYLEHVRMLHVYWYEYTAFHLQLTMFPLAAMFCGTSSEFRKRIHTINKTALDSVIPGHCLCRHHPDYHYDYHNVFMYFY